MTYSRKTEKYLSQNIFTRNGRKWICHILFLTLWLMIPPCFLLKIVQIVQTVIIFMTDLISPWLKFFCKTIIFDFGHLHGQTRAQKLDQKCKLWGLSFSIKTRILKIFSKKFFFFFFASAIPGQFWKTGPYLGSKSKYLLKATNFFLQRINYLLQKLLLQTRATFVSIIRN